jgi:hypothetical protein
MWGLKCIEISATNEPQKQQGSYNHVEPFSEDSRIIQCNKTGRSMRSTQTPVKRVLVIAYLRSATVSGMNNTKMKL